MAKANKNGLLREMGKTTKVAGRIGWWKISKS